MLFSWRRARDSLRKVLPCYHAWVAKGRCLPFVGNLYKLQSTLRLPIPTRSNPYAVIFKQQKRTIKKMVLFCWRRARDSLLTFVKQFTVISYLCFTKVFGQPLKTIVITFCYKFTIFSFAESFLCYTPFFVKLICFFYINFVSFKYFTTIGWFLFEQAHI